MNGTTDMHYVTSSSVLSDECIEELAGKTGASPERIRAIEAKALAALRIAVVTEPFPARLVAALVRQIVRD